MTITAVVLGLILFAVFAAFIIVTRMLFICPPNEVLIFSGTHRRIGSADGRVVGYRLVQGGRGIRIPLFEVVDRMNLTNMVIDLRVAGAYSKGGIPLNVQGVANVKISSQTTHLANAIERFLGRKREEIMSVARETLEGNLRGVLATLTPEEVNQDREKFAQALLHEADTDLARLGLELDTLKIQSVSDDKGYLDSIGRKQTAELIKRSRIAEAENTALSAERTADNKRTQELAKIDAAILEARAQAAAIILDAQTGKDALVSEARAAVQALVAKALAEVNVQRARIEQVRYRLIADQVRPAEARRAQLIAEAHGAAATLKEEGRASAEAVRSLGMTWAQNGENARQIFVAQKLAPLVRSLMGTVGELEVNKISVIDKHLTQGGNLAVQAATFSEQLKQTTGVDLTGLVANRTAPRE